MERPISSTVQKRVSKQNTKISEPTTQETSEIMSQEKESKLLTHVESNLNAQVDTIQASNFTATASEDVTTHELSHLMQRPTLIENGTITADKTTVPHSYNRMQWQAMKTNFTNTYGLITAIGFPSSIITKNPVVAAKIKQFSYFKGDMKLEIKINKAPQVSGCLMVVYFPRGGLDIDKTNFTLQGLTSLPYKILDYSTDTSLTMTVPYIDEVDYFNFQQALPNGSNPPEDYGFIGVFNIIAPTSGVSNASVSYSLFGSFENIELRLPTADTITAPTPYMAQSGRIQRIPADDMMSGVSESSKISLNYSSHEIDNSKVKYDSNETSLKYVLNRENIMGKLYYNASDGANHYMGKVRCFPKRPVCFSHVKDGTYKPFYTPISMQYGTFDYVSNLFQRWTGTIEIGIRLIKTKFHYGRIAVVFDPFGRINDANTGGLGTLLSTNYSAIIDLNAENGEEGGSNYYRFPIPYMNNVGYTSIGRDFRATGSFQDQGTSKFVLPQAQSSVFNWAVPDIDVNNEREVYNPYLRFYALTELGHLDAASNSVPILVSIKAGHDFDLSIPTVNVAQTTPPIDPDPSVFYCQSGSIRLVPSEISSSVANENTCSGEKITDLMTLTKRFTPVTIRVSDNPPYFDMMTKKLHDDPGDESQEVYVDFPNRGFTGAVLGLTGNTLTGFKMSNVEAVQALYKFTYGGRKYKCAADEVGSTMMARLIHMGRQRPDGKFNDMAPCGGVTYPLSGSMVVNTAINNFLEVERNFYSNRKLISKMSDDVVTQLVSFSPNKTYTYPEPASAGTPDDFNCIRRIGPHIKREGGSLRRMPHIDLTDLDNLYNDANTPSTRGLSEYASHCMEEASYPTSEITSAKFAATNLGAVLEAMPENAGFTFLMNPPCVAFL